MDLRRGGNTNGFTIIELLVVMVLAGFAMTAIFSTFRIQQASYETQRQVAAMQQHLRAGMFMMVRELRMAGADPTDTGIDNGAKAGFEVAEADRVRFTMDINDAGDNWRYDGDVDDTNEDITYGLYTPTSDGIPKLGRRSPATTNYRPVAEYIDALQFEYLDGDGAVTTDRAAIRSVRVTMRARTANTTPLQTETLTTYVNCRNMGL